MADAVLKQLPKPQKSGVLFWCRFWSPRPWGSSAYCELPWRDLILLINMLLFQKSSEMYATCCFCFFFPNFLVTVTGFQFNTCWSFWTPVLSMVWRQINQQRSENTWSYLWGNAVELIHLFCQRLWHYLLFLFDLILIGKKTQNLLAISLEADSWGLHLITLSFWYDYQACPNSLKIVRNTANVGWLMTHGASVFHHCEQACCISNVQL